MSAEEIPIQSRGISFANRIKFSEKILAVFEPFAVIFYICIISISSKNPISKQKDFITKFINRLKTIN